MKKKQKVNASFIDLLHLTDIELIEKIQQNNIFAKEVLYKRYKEYIRKFVYKYFLSVSFQTSSLDIEHELYFAFEDALHAYHKQCETETKQSATFKTYLTSVILNRLSDIHNKLNSFSSHHCLMDFQELYSQIEDEEQDERDYCKNNLLNNVYKNLKFYQNFFHE